MKDKFFIDTNIFVYSFDSTAPRKQEISKNIIQEAFRLRKGIISFQVVQEFLNVASRKFEKVLSQLDCRKYLDRFLEPLCEVYSSAELYRLALDISGETNFSFYDSLILSAAIEGNCKSVITEDLGSEQVVRGVRIINPY